MQHDRFAAPKCGLDVRQGCEECGCYIVRVGCSVGENASHQRQRCRSIEHIIHTAELHRHGVRGVVKGKFCRASIDASQEYISGNGIVRLGTTSFECIVGWHERE